MNTIELAGKYGSAKVFADIVDDTSISQIINMLNQPFAEGQTVRMMPDVHAGAGCTIGTTMTIGDKIVPNLVGVDIGCGMLVVRLDEEEIDFDKLDAVIRRHVPSGFDIRETRHTYANEGLRLEELLCKDGVDLNRAYLSVGTLGGGNHFIEVDKASDGTLYLIIHSGSRHLGKQIADYYQKLAYDRLNGCSDNDVQNLIAKLKAEGRQREIQDALHRLKDVKRTNIPKELAYLEGKDMDAYLHDMHIAQVFARYNRAAIAKEITEKAGLHIRDYFTTVHNYIDIKNNILRKGAVSAYKDELLLIPMNMRDGSLLCVGKGNPDWNCSAPHGAGRIMSRAEAKRRVGMEEFRQSMEGIYTTSVNTSTIDESPMAYKPMEAITGCIGDTVDVVDVIKPIYNFKAGEE